MIHVCMWCSGCIACILPVKGSAPPEDTVPVDSDPGIYRPAPAQTNINISHTFDFILANNKRYSKRPTCERITAKSLVATSCTRNVASRTWEHTRDMKHTSVLTLNTVCICECISFRLPVKGSAAEAGAGPRVWPLVFSMMKLATWSKNMGLRSFFSRKLWAVSQGSSATL